MDTGYATSTGDPPDHAGPPSPHGGGRMVQAAAEFSPDTDVPRSARGFLRTTLSSWDLDDLSEVATLLGNELVTNAVVHARTALRLTASYRPPELTVEVWDRSAAQPVLGSAHRVDRTHGRGLVLVESFAARWGVRSVEGHKVVWFALRAP
jgi:anti-sigma regulatory factor (Ser/Thr protein kinase)